jgi:hypothetical protein
MIDVMLVRLMIFMVVAPLLGGGVGAQARAGTQTEARAGSGAGALGRDVLNDATMSPGEREAILSGVAAPSPQDAGVDRHPALQARAQAAPPRDRVGVDKDSARRTLMWRHVGGVFPGTKNYEALQTLPIMGDQDQLRVALAAFELQEVDYAERPTLLRKHLSRLMAEKLLGRPATRVKDVASVLEFERAEGASFSRLQQDIFRKLMEISLLTHDVIPDLYGVPDLKAEVRQATFTDLEVTGRLRFRITQARGAGAPFEGECEVRPASSREWSAAPGGGRIAAVSCAAYDVEARLAEYRLALERVRAGQASAEIAPVDVMVLPVSLEASLPWGQAAELISGGGCRATDTCQNRFKAWLTEIGPQVVVMGFLVAQLVVAVVLLWLSQRAPLYAASRGLKWSLAYLALVALTHLAMVAWSLATGSLLFLLGWIYLGVPLFVPGFFLGLAAVWWAFTNAALRPAKIVLGVLAVTTPMLEWLLMSGVMRSGYGGY